MAGTRFRRTIQAVLLLGTLPAPGTLAWSADWPTWGGSPARNMVSAETGLPDLSGDQAIDFNQKQFPPVVKWRARLGRSTCGTPTVAAGRVFVGTSSDEPEGGAIACLDEATGALLWRAIVPVRTFVDPARPNYKFAANLSSLRTLGVCSSPAVGGNRVYVVSNRGEVLCFSATGQDRQTGGQTVGLTAENRGAESTYLDDPAAPRRSELLWAFDLWSDERVRARPADCFSNSVLVHGELLYVCTSNGQDMNWGPNLYPNPVTRPNPDGPSLIVLEKTTGRLVAQDGERIGRRVFQGQWSSPCLGEAAGRTLVIYAAGDGVCYAFEALTGVPREPTVLKKVWWFDCNLEEYRLRDKQGNLVDYRLGDHEIKNAAKDHPNSNDGTYGGENQIVGTPVFHGGRVYVAIGRDPRHGRGRGALHCLDAGKTGDLRPAGVCWTYTGLERTVSTVSVADGLVYVADLAGRLHCVDEQTGQRHWVHGEPSWRYAGVVWASTLAADGKLYFPTRKYLEILTAARTKQPLSRTALGSECSPVVANGTLYIVSRGYLWALASTSKGKRSSRTP